MKKLIIKVVKIPVLFIACPTAFVVVSFYSFSMTIKCIFTGEDEFEVIDRKGGFAERVYLRSLLGVV